ncbi:YSC84-related protein [Candidatus Kuenenia sp.]|uniref:lipid-binding SYLF domain-containing protein n=1 Tax=Candidatus Kuenenia sp. TaxID=2499824 RepID=UPI0032203B4B
MKKPLIIMFFIVSITSVHITNGYAGWKPSVEDESVQGKSSLNTQAEEVISNFKIHYPHLTLYFEKAYGYAVFPTITKGGIGIGAAHGTGEVYEKGEFIGTVSMTQVTIGVQFGGQTFSEIIFFKDKETLEDFKKGNFKPGARASAVAATAGTSTDADYEHGVAIFTLSNSGLMFEATLGGQKFNFKPKP